MAAGVRPVSMALPEALVVLGISLAWHWPGLKEESLLEIDVADSPSPPQPHPW